MLILVFVEFIAYPPPASHRLRLQARLAGRSHSGKAGGVIGFKAIFVQRPDLIYNA